MPHDLKIGPQWNVTAEDANTLAGAYGWTLASGKVTPLGGAVNGVARIGTSIGDLVLRVHRPWTTPARLTAVHAVQDRLRRLGIPIPEVVPTSTGETFVTMPGDPRGTAGTEHHRLAEVTRLVAADTGRETRDHADLVLAMLAPLHNALATIGPASVPPPAYAAHVDAGEALAWLDATDPAFATCAGFPHFKRAEAVRGAAREPIERIQLERLALDAELARQLVHGDPGFGNVLTRGRQVVAILDFDFMAERPRIFDLAYALYHAVIRIRSGRCSGALTAGELGRLAGQVAAYSRAAGRPLAEPELAALPLEMGMVGLYQVVEAGFVTDDPARAIAQTLSVERHLPLLGWLATQPRDLASACCLAIRSAEG